MDQFLVIIKDFFLNRNLLLTGVGVTHCTITGTIRVVFHIRWSKIVPERSIIPQNVFLPCTHVVIV